MPKKRVYKYVYDESRVLGKGQFGIVYCGKVDFEGQKPQTVAIKVLKKQMVNQDIYHKEAFISQIKTLRKVVSQNIVGFRQVIQTANNYYIVQQYCDGGDLQNLLKKQGPLDEKVATKLMTQILTGFFDIMRCGIVHRDFKPQNVLISKGKLKIADFGLARSTGDMLNSEVGTPVYQSPQILNGQLYSSKCDIWAIGLVFYQMLYGKLPWSIKAGKKSYYNQIMNVKLTFPQSPMVSDEIKKFIQNCLVRSQAGRMDWPQLFRNQIFEDNLPNYQILDHIFSYTVNQIINTLQDECIDVQKLFIKYNSHKSQHQMTRKDLHLMIQKLAPNVKSYHIDFILSKFDKNSNGKIQFDEFKKTLKEGQQLRAVLSPDEIKTVLFRWAEHQNQKLSQGYKKLWAVLQKSISTKIKQKKIDKLQLFSKYYLQNKTEKLNLKQFSELLREIDSSINDKQCQFLFRRFDSDGDDLLSAQQFFQHFKKFQ